MRASRKDEFPTPLLERMHKRSWTIPYSKAAM